MADDLQGKVALVTGAGTGIGEACALRLARGGAKVAVVDVNLQAAQSVAKAIGETNAIAVHADVSEPAAVEQMIATVVRRFDGLDIAVNNAGIGGERVPTGDYSYAEWRSVMSVNLDGVFYCMRAEIRSMRSTGAGSIINMASVLGSVAFQSSVAYVAAKHGVVGLTQTAALEYAPDGIRVNAVAPAFIATPLLKANMGQEEQAAVGVLHPLGRLGEPSEVAELAAWLAGDASSFVTGAFYPVDGGYLTQ